jgi:hypothetical protein
MGRSSAEMELADLEIVQAAPVVIESQTTLLS